MNTRCQAWIYLFCFSLSAGFAQQSAPAGQPESPAPVPSAGRSRSITLDVVVTDKSGKPVPGLQQQDFTLLDNKQPTKIVSFDAIQSGAAKADPPVEIVVLVDEVNSSFRAVAVAREEIEKFLKQNGGQLEYPVSLVFLSDMGVTGTASSRDGNALVAELDQNKAGLRIIGKNEGFYGAGDRVQLSLHALEQFAGYEAPKPGRKLVIWLSPGWPLLTGPRIELTSKQQQGLFANIVALSDAMR